MAAVRGTDEADDDAWALPVFALRGEPAADEEEDEDDDE